MVAVWLSGNALALINVVALRRSWLVLGWITGDRSRVYHLGILTKPPGLLRLAIPPWVGAMSTGDGLGHR